MSALDQQPDPGRLHAVGNASDVQGNVLAVLGGALDAAAVDLALVLAREDRVSVDLLLSVEVPIAYPMRAYGRWLEAHDGMIPLMLAEKICGSMLGDSAALLTRSVGPALVAWAHERHSAGIVISAPAGGWWMRWRGRRAIAHVQAQADCRVYVVHVPPAEPWEDVPRVAAQ